MEGFHTAYISMSHMVTMKAMRHRPKLKAPMEARHVLFVLVHEIPLQAMAEWRGAVSP